MSKQQQPAAAWRLGASRASCGGASQQAAAPLYLPLIPLHPSHGAGFTLHSQHFASHSLCVYNSLPNYPTLLCCRHAAPTPHGPGAPTHHIARRIRSGHSSQSVQFYRSVQKTPAPERCSKGLSSAEQRSAAMQHSSMQSAFCFQALTPATQTGGASVACSMQSTVRPAAHLRVHVHAQRHASGAGHMPPSLPLRRTTALLYCPAPLAHPPPPPPSCDAPPALQHFKAPTLLLYCTVAIQYSHPPPHLATQAVAGRPVPLTPRVPRPTPVLGAQRSAA